eukprot:gene9905-biopygen8907
MWSGADDVRRKTSGFVGKPWGTSEDLGKPRKTSEDLGRVSGKSRESLGGIFVKDLVQSNRGKPQKSVGKVSEKSRKSPGEMQRKPIGGSAEAVSEDHYAKAGRRPSPPPATPSVETGRCVWGGCGGSGLGNLCRPPQGEPDTKGSPRPIHFGHHREGGLLGHTTPAARLFGQTLLCVLASERGAQDFPWK